MSIHIFRYIFKLLKGRPVSVLAVRDDQCRQVIHTENMYSTNYPSICIHMYLSIYISISKMYVDVYIFVQFPY